MSAPTIIPNAFAVDLFNKGQAVIDDDTLATRTAMYAWDDKEQLYKRTHAGLRVIHHRGTKWDTERQRFVVCYGSCCDTYHRHCTNADVAP